MQIKSINFGERRNAVRKKVNLETVPDTKTQEKKNLPRIEIDRDAIRFEFVNGAGTNLFWIDLFRSNGAFHNELTSCLFRAYNECVKNDKEK